ncbi:MAG: hypothetical protein ACE5EU_07505, partial [Paracoccaceae bacterium]
MLGGAGEFPLPDQNFGGIQPRRQGGLRVAGLPGNRRTFLIDPDRLAEPPLRRAQRLRRDGR